jgi:hypothetical protein
MKVTPWYANGGTEGWRRYITNFFAVSILEGVGSFIPGKTRETCTGGWVGLGVGLHGHKNLPPPGFYQRKILEKYEYSSVSTWKVSDSRRCQWMYMHTWNYWWIRRSTYRGLTTSKFMDCFGTLTATPRMRDRLVAQSNAGEKTETCALAFSGVRNMDPAIPSLEGVHFRRRIHSF